MKILSSAFLIFIASSLSGCIVVAGGPTSHNKSYETLELDANGVDTLEIDAGAGSLEVRGDDQIAKIKVEAQIFSDDESYHKLTLVKNGDVAELHAEINSSNSYRMNNNGRINLRVTVPSHLALDIGDGSGGIIISGLKNDIELDDGSGEIEIMSVTGNIDIEDGSGEMRISNITGNTTIEDGSGEITVVNVSGHVTIDDGSGDINVKRAGGLTVSESGSGELYVRDVEGHLSLN